MFHSKFNDDEKRQILKEKKETGVSVEKICRKYSITIQTYYKWKHKFENNAEIHVTIESPLEEQNIKLKKLYFDLSEHNYELAKFLNQ